MHRGCAQLIESVPHSRGITHRGSLSLRSGMISAELRFIQLIDFNAGSLSRVGLGAYSCAGAAATCESQSLLHKRLECGRPCRRSFCIPSSTRELRGDGHESALHYCWDRWACCSRLRDRSGRRPIHKNLDHVAHTESPAVLRGLGCFVLLSAFS